MKHMKDDSIVEDKYNTGVCADTDSSTTLEDTRRKNSHKSSFLFQQSLLILQV
jgi:hypothetical protein